MPTNNTENIYSTEFENNPNPIPSTRVGYDNTNSGLEATTVQGAIDELDSKIDSLDGSDIEYDGTESGLEAENVQGAIDEIVSSINANTIEMVDIDLPLPDNSTFATLISSNGLFTLMQGVIDNLNDDEYIMVHALAISPTFSAYNLHPIGKNLWKKGDTLSTTNYSGVFYDMGNSKHIINTARIASSNSHLHKLDILNSDTSITVTDFTSSETVVTEAKWQVLKFKKGI